MSRSISNHSRRWFIYSLSGLFIFLCLAIILAAILLLRRGYLPRTGLITGSSMEPILRGPRFSLTCSSCSESQEFALDTCKSNQPFRCRQCDKLDMGSVFDFDDIESLDARTRPGAQVRFASLRSIRKNRAKEIANGNVHASGLIRGDLVVLQEPHESKKEVKRIVGFAFEQVAIEGGDLFVDGKRWCKSLEQALRQSILLNAWERPSPKSQSGRANRLNGGWEIEREPFQGVLSAIDSPEQNVDDARTLSFGYSLPHRIDNLLTLNAHDSHIVVPVNDFGFTFQLSRPDHAWKLKCKLNSPVCQPDIGLELDGGTLSIETSDDHVKMDLLFSEDHSIWIVIAMVDGHLIVGNQDEEWLRRELPIASVEMAHDDTRVKSPIAMEIISGRLALDQLLVFRDVFYRGQNDSETQSWESGEHLVVLGDNVSASSDSRDRWPDGLSPSSVKGVVLQTESPMEVLLRQR